jgi:hypothetical protein
LGVGVGVGVGALSSLNKSPIAFIKSSVESVSVVEPVLVSTSFSGVGVIILFSGSSSGAEFNASFS